MKQQKNYNFKDLALGQTYETQFFINPSDVQNFIELIGDTSPLHQDPSFAEKHGFEGSVVPGVYIGSLISSMFGSHFPGHQSICLSLELSFLQPIYMNHQLKVISCVKQLSEATQAVNLSVEVYRLDTLCTKAFACIQFLQKT